MGCLILNPGLVQWMIDTGSRPSVVDDWYRFPTYNKLFIERFSKTFKESSFQLCHTIHATTGTRSSPGDDQALSNRHLYMVKCCHLLFSVSTSRALHYLDFVDMIRSFNRVFSGTRVILITYIEMIIENTKVNFNFDKINYVFCKIWNIQIK